MCAISRDCSRKFGICRRVGTNCGRRQPRPSYEESRCCHSICMKHRHGRTRHPVLALRESTPTVTPRLPPCLSCSLNLDSTKSAVKCVYSKYSNIHLVGGVAYPGNASDLPNQTRNSFESNSTNDEYTLPNCRRLITLPRDCPW